MKDMPDLHIESCSRPICYRNDNDDFIYSTRGSCFLVWYKDRLYAITAKHVTADWRGDQIRIPYYIGSNQFFSPSTRIEISTPEAEDTDHKDLVIYEIRLDDLEKDGFDTNKAYNLSYIGSFSQISNHLLIAGFPQEVNSVDYETREINFQPYCLRAKYLGGYGLGIGKLKFESNVDLKEFDGLSGSPVFKIPQSGTEHKAELYGVMIRATVQSLCGYFIYAKFILNALEIHSTGKSTRLSRGESRA